ncbi:MAG TPA: GxxExxY protein [bacterium]|nr:GxxExxY protein [bacterium]
MTENEIGTLVIEKAITIHRDFGPGLLESVYEVVLHNELKRSGLIAMRQVPIPFEYHGIKFNESFRADIIVDHKVILEIKSVENVNNVFKKQVLTYLRLTHLKLGYLLNFGEELMKNGIYRIINGTLD